MAPPFLKELEGEVDQKQEALRMRGVGCANTRSLQVRPKSSDGLADEAPAAVAKKKNVQKKKKNEMG